MDNGNVLRRNQRFLRRLHEISVSRATEINNPVGGVTPPIFNGESQSENEANSDYESDSDTIPYKEEMESDCDTIPYEEEIENDKEISKNGRSYEMIYTTRTGRLVKRKKPIDYDEL